MLNFRSKTAFLIFILCFIISSKLSGHGINYAQAEESRKLEVKKLMSVEIKDNEGGELTVGKEKIKFTPQSFTVKDGFKIGRAHV